MLIFGKALNAKRRELGLSHVSRFSAYAAGYSRNLLALDPVLVPPGRGWRYPYQYVGYPFGGDDGALSAEVEAFLAAGPRPLYFGFGSVCLPHPERTTRILLGAIARVGCRAIVDRGWTGLGEGVTVPDGVLLLRGGAPHRQLFPRMAGLIHHGGSGTTHNAARAGVPQAIVPHLLDQYFWGQRVANLGLGPQPVPHADLTESRLVRILRELQGPTYRHQARVVAGLMRTDGVVAIADAVERALGGRAAAPTAAVPRASSSARDPWAEAGGHARPAV
jgi:UDP:flavonoid glycosyltransferase YjiC (YdhE family)